MLGVDESGVGGESIEGTGKSTRTGENRARCRKEKLVGLQEPKVQGMTKTKTSMVIMDKAKILVLPPKDLGYFFILCEIISHINYSHINNKQISKCTSFRNTQR